MHQTPPQLTPFAATSFPVAKPAFFADSEIEKSFGRIPDGYAASERDFRPLGALLFFQLQFESTLRFVMATTRRSVRMASALGVFSFFRSVKYLLLSTLPLGHLAVEGNFGELGRIQIFFNPQSTVSLQQTTATLLAWGWLRR